MTSSLLTGKDIWRIAAALTLRTRGRTEIDAALAERFGSRPQRCDRAELARLGRGRLIAFWREQIEASPEIATLAAELLELHRAPTMPPTLEQLKTAARAAAVEARAILTGAHGIGQEEQTRRLAICHACPRLDPETERCAECGCFVRVKSAWRTQHCPIEKW